MFSKHPLPTTKETGHQLWRVPVPVSFLQRSKAPYQGKIMITIFIKDCNQISQKFYDQIVTSLPFHRIQCTCGKKGCLICYGHYSRNVKWMSVLVKLSIQRVMCTECHHTHALIPSFLVPYSQVSLQEHQEILISLESHQQPVKVMLQNLLIDESNIKYIVRQFRKHWKQRLLAIGAALLGDLTVPCLSAYSRQFMQIHRTRNILFCPPT